LFLHLDGHRRARFRSDCYPPEIALSLFQPLLACLSFFFCYHHGHVHASSARKMGALTPVPDPESGPVFGPLPPLEDQNEGLCDRLVSPPLRFSLIPLAGLFFFFWLPFITPRTFFEHFPASVLFPPSSDVVGRFVKFTFIFGPGTRPRFRTSRV